MGEEKKCCVIVAGMESCSRPPVLKKFLYLDFIDSTKHQTVWSKLLGTISENMWGCGGCGNVEGVVWECGGCGNVEGVVWECGGMGMWRVWYGM